jgi:hypothetical protein
MIQLSPFKSPEERLLSLNSAASEHSAQFNRPVQQSRGFYLELLHSLGIPVQL